jgi:hypothetical protein
MKMNAETHQDEGCLFFITSLLAYWDDERGHEGECTALALLIYVHSRLKALAMEFNNALQEPPLMPMVLLARVLYDLRDMTKCSTAITLNNSPDIFSGPSVLHSHH